MLEEIMSFPLVYSDLNFDPCIANSARINAIKQRMQERQHKIYITDINQDTACQIANNILGEPNPEPLHTPIICDLTQKLKDIQQRTQSRQEKLSQVDQGYEKAIQIADQAFTKAEREIQDTKRLEIEQTASRQQMLIVSQDLKTVCKKALHLKHNQAAISQDIALMQTLLREALAEVAALFPALEKVFLEISKIKFNHKEINHRFESLFEQSKLIQLDKIDLSHRLHALVKPDSSLSEAAEWIMNANIFQHPLVKEKVKECLDAHPIFGLAEDLAENLSEEKFNQAWEEIQTTATSVSSYFWTHLTSATSYTVSWVAWAAIEVQQLKDKVIPSLMEWGWSYMVNQVSPTTWIAIGIFASCFSKTIITNYPVLSLATFGYVCLVYMNYDYVKLMMYI